MRGGGGQGGRHRRYGGGAVVPEERLADTRAVVEPSCRAAVSREATALAVVDGIATRKAEAAAVAADMDHGEVDWAGLADCWGK